MKVIGVRAKAKMPVLLMSEGLGLKDFTLPLYLAQTGFIALALT